MRNRMLSIEMCPKEGLCCICGRPYFNYGHDPYPVVEKKNNNARCCDDCYSHKVLKAKLLMPECPNKK